MSPSAAEWLWPVAGRRRALGIEALLTWAFRDQRCEIDPPQRVIAGLGSAALADMAELGDGRLGSGVQCYAQGWRLHPDADAIWLATRRLEPLQQRLVAACAKAAARPDALIGAADFVDEPVLRMWMGRMVPLRRYDRNRNFKGFVTRRVDQRPRLARARAQYTAWHNAVVALAVVLSGRLAAHDIVGPLPPATPWLEESS